MRIKIYYNEEIHKLSVLPATLAALIDDITHLFNSKLPAAWVIQYQDEEGDLVMITHDQDYRELFESKPAKSSATIKLIITPVAQTNANAPFVANRADDYPFLDSERQLLQANGSGPSRNAKSEMFGLSDLQIRILQHKSIIWKFMHACRRRNYSQMTECRNILAANIPELMPMLDRAVSAASNAQGCCSAKRAMRGIRKDFMAQFFPEGGCRALKQWRQYQKSLKKTSNEEKKTAKCGGGWLSSLFRKIRSSTGSKGAAYISCSAVETEMTESIQNSKLKVKFE